ncbi:HAD family hydrolase [Ruminococcus gauvreauii]|uniref:HAD family phosphatase n=1 Tax=Ruminococcus gauvreauii TaxID=438033 RepID=A0ABY5VGD7_9FIRM|nr:HAD family phosphatase [Ruminococcus gauvreauii]UWP59649.1 HAD family phosphatase [Ruminococcus gauvreauii]
MLKDKKAMLFDLDGTLVDSMWMWKDIDFEYLSSRGKELPDTLQHEIEGMSFTETAGYFKKRFGLKDSVDTIKEEWLFMARDKYLHETPLKDGVFEFIMDMQKKDIRMGIASSNSRELVEAILKVHRLEECFSSVHTCCDVKSGKPEPDIYLLVAGELDVDPRQCLVFEDIPAGIMAGKRAGMQTCAVWDAYSVSQDEQKKNLADYYIHTYRDILEGSYEVLNTCL